MTLERALSMQWRPNQHKIAFILIKCFYVLVMPSMPRLRSSNRNLEGRFIVSLPEQDKSIAVQCEALGGNPPPDFVWKLNDVTLESAKPPGKLVCA